MQPWRWLEFGLYFNAKITRQKKNINDSNAAKNRMVCIIEKDGLKKKEKKKEGRGHLSP